MPAANLNEEENLWLTQAANRLRRVHAAGLNTTPEARRERLQEEFSKTLETIPSQNRKGCLEALLAQFPGGAAKQRGAAAPEVRPAHPAKKQTPEEILESFLTATAKFSEQERAPLAIKLAEAGFSWVDREALVVEIGEKLREALGLPAGQQPRLTRLVDLAILLVNELHGLNQAALGTVSELDRKNAALKKTPQDFRKAAADFLVNDSNGAQVRALFRLVGALLAAMQGGGRDFAREYLNRFSPDVIEDFVQGTKPGGWGKFTREKDYWEKFKDLAKDFATPELIDRKIKDSFASFLEKKI